jgi:hypothetical protein
MEDSEIIKKILKHLNLWDLKARPLSEPEATKRSNATPSNIHIDYSYCQVPTSDDYPYVDAEYLKPFQPDFFNWKKEVLINQLSTYQLNKEEVISSCNQNGHIGSIRNLSTYAPHK